MIPNYTVPIGMLVMRMPIRNMILAVLLVDVASIHDTVLLADVLHFLHSAGTDAVHEVEHHLEPHDVETQQQPQHDVEEEVEHVVVPVDDVDRVTGREEN